MLVPSFPTSVRRFVLLAFLVALVFSASTITSSSAPPDLLLVDEGAQVLLAGRTDAYVDIVEWDDTDSLSFYGVLRGRVLRAGHHHHHSSSALHRRGRSSPPPPSA